MFAMPKIKSLTISVAVGAILIASPAFAVDKVYSPNVVKGELELEYIGSTTFDGDREKDNDQEHEFELEYGLTDRLVLQVAGVYENGVDENLDHKVAEIGGHYQFFEQGEYWVDTGLLLAYGQATHAEDASEIEAKLLLEKQTGKFLHRMNIGTAKEIGSNRESGYERSILWSSRYRYNEYFEPGFEIQSDFGKASEHKGFDEQEHLVGPAIYGKILPNLKYEAVYYKGISDAAPNSAARLLLEYEMYF